MELSLWKYASRVSFKKHIHVATFLGVCSDFCCHTCRDIAPFFGDGKINVFVCEAYGLGEESPGDHCEILQQVHIGYIKMALRHMNEKSSSDEHCTIHRQPSLKLTVKKAFKSGSLTLVALSNNVSVYSIDKVKESNKAISIGECFKNGDTSMIGVVKSHLTFPKVSKSQDVAKKDVDAFLVGYWACNESHDPSKVNARRTFGEVSINVGSDVAVKVKVPLIVNTKQLNRGDEVVVAKTSEGVAEEEPPLKKQRPLEGNGKSSGKCKGKGKGKGKR